MQQLPFQLKEPTWAEQCGIIYQMRQAFGIVADSDSYKLTHHCQYVKGAQRMESYVESRGGAYDKILFFGAQLIVKEYFLQRLTHAQVDRIVAFEKAHFMDNITDDFEIALRTVVDEYGGKMPIEIRAVKEGSIVPVKNVLMIISSTVDDPRVFSLVSYFETKLLRVWSPTTIATISYHIREVILNGLMITTPNTAYQVVKYALHDFGSRGATSMEHIAFGGLGHLVSFGGTDSIAAIMAAEFGYHEPMAGHSIPASEHSSTCSHGPDGEYGFVENMFNRFAKPGAMFATVIDSYNALRFVREIAPQFKDRLIKSGAKWVFRPDSCDPVEMPIKIICELDKVFGHTINENGYKVLNNVSVIQGDGITIVEVEQIIARLLQLKYCVSNMAFGMGGGLIQKNDRDTQKMSMKCSAVKVDGIWYEVYKDPAVFDENWNLLDEKSFKLSKRGRLDLIINDTGEYETITYLNEPSGVESQLDTILKDGYIYRDMTFAEVRNNAGTFVN